MEEVGEVAVGRPNDLLQKIEVLDIRNFNLLFHTVSLHQLDKWSHRANILLTEKHGRERLERKTRGVRIFGIRNLRIEASLEPNFHIGSTLQSCDFSGRHCSRFSAGSSLNSQGFLLRAVNLANSGCSLLF